MASINLNLGNVGSPAHERELVSGADARSCTFLTFFLREMSELGKLTKENGEERYRTLSQPLSDYLERSFYPDPSENSVRSIRNPRLINWSEIANLLICDRRRVTLEIKKIVGRDNISDKVLFKWIGQFINSIPSRWSRENLSIVNLCAWLYSYFLHRNKTLLNSDKTFVRQWKKMKDKIENIFSSLSHNREAEGQSFFELSTETVCSTGFLRQWTPPSSTCLYTFNEIADVLAKRFSQNKAETMTLNWQEYIRDTSHKEAKRLFAFKALNKMTDPLNPSMVLKMIETSDDLEDSAQQFQYTLVLRTSQKSCENTLLKAEHLYPLKIFFFLRYANLGSQSIWQKIIDTLAQEANHCDRWSKDEWRKLVSLCKGCPPNLQHSLWMSLLSNWKCRPNTLINKIRAISLFTIFLLPLPTSVRNDLGLWIANNIPNLNPYTENFLEILYFSGFCSSEIKHRLFTQVLSSLSMSPGKEIVSSLLRYAETAEASDTFPSYLRHIMTKLPTTLEGCEELIFVILKRIDRLDSDETKKTLLHRVRAHLYLAKENYNEKYGQFASKFFEEFLPLCYKKIDLHFFSAHLFNYMFNETTQFKDWESLGGNLQQLYNAHTQNLINKTESSPKLCEKLIFAILKRIDRVNMEEVRVSLSKQFVDRLLRMKEDNQVEYKKVMSLFSENFLKKCRQEIDMSFFREHFFDRIFETTTQSSHDLLQQWHIDQIPMPFFSKLYQRSEETKRRDMWLHAFNQIPDASCWPKYLSNDRCRLSVAAKRQLFEKIIQNLCKENVSGHYMLNCVQVSHLFSDAITPEDHRKMWDMLSKNSLPFNDLQGPNNPWELFFFNILLCPEDLQDKFWETLLNTWTQLQGERQGELWDRIGEAIDNAPPLWFLNKLAKIILNLQFPQDATVLCHILSFADQCQKDLKYSLLEKVTNSLPQILENEYIDPMKAILRLARDRSGFVLESFHKYRDNKLSEPGCPSIEDFDQFAQTFSAGLTKQLMERSEELTTNYFKEVMKKLCGLKRYEKWFLICVTSLNDEISRTVEKGAGRLCAGKF